MTQTPDLSPQRIQALGVQFTELERDLAELTRQTRAALLELGPVRDYAELHRRVDDLAACLLDDTDPEITSGVQARLYIHAQENKP